MTQARDASDRQRPTAFWRMVPRPNARQHCAHGAVDRKEREPLDKEGSPPGLMV